jgi:hypothetical protein
MHHGAIVLGDKHVGTMEYARGHACICSLLAYSCFTHPPISPTRYFSFSSRTVSIGEGWAAATGILLLCVANMRIVTRAL